jgi:hypothetical protein
MGAEHYIIVIDEHSDHYTITIEEDDVIIDDTNTEGIVDF